MSMEDLLKGFLGGADSQARGRQAGGDPLSDLLGGILGGMTAPQGGGGGTGLDDILGGILGGGAQGAGGASLGDILGGILGGGAQGAGGAGLGDILGGILGGGGAAQAGGGIGMDDILGAILGRGGANLGANSFLAPIVQALAEKLGLSPAIAQAVVGFVITKLLPGLLAGARAPAPSSTGRGRAVPSTQEGQGLDLDHLLGTMGAGQELEPAYLRSTGMVDELAQQTGLDPDTAMQSLQQVFGMFGAQLGGAPPAEEKKGLDHLLDTWEV
jgi:hypothetical protein